MIKVAIVEDQQDDFNLLSSYIRKYGEEKNLIFDIVHFSNGLNFIDEYTGDFEVVFMDIEMPHMDGMETARKLREMDASVSLVFVTNMIQYAIDGYEVDAMDFMVKPVKYYNFAQKLEKAITHAKRRTEKNIVVHTQDGVSVIPAKEIFYVEKERNYLILHTERGIFRERGTISELAEELADMGFSKCFSSCIVNLAYVSDLKKDTLVVHGTVLPISRRQKKDFMVDFAGYYGGTV